MKKQLKQFYRVKQLADQAIFRADKSEVLNYAELQIAEARVEYLRNAISAIVKRLPSGGQGNDIDKRIQKSQEYRLAQVLAEQAAKKNDHQEDDCLFQQIIKQCGDAENDLARAYAEFEMQVEEDISGPLQSALDTDFPIVTKHRRNVQKYMLDRDSASNRYHSTKREATMKEMEEADIKVEQTRDALANEMFTVLASENRYSNYILKLLQLQSVYHASALDVLEQIIPKLEQQISDSPVKKIFGTSLQEHLRVHKKRIAFPLEVCVVNLLQFGLFEEGLLRIAGGQIKSRRLQAAIDSGCLVQLIPEYRDPHMLATLLKKYLRDLPEPLLTFDLYDKWMQAVQLPENRKMEAIKKLIAELPQGNRENLAYLIQFFAEVTRHPENKMNAFNISVVVAVNLLWPRENTKDMKDMNVIASVNNLVEFLIREADTLFPDDVSHLVSLPPELRLDPEEALADESTSHATGKGHEHNPELNISSENIHAIDSPKPNSRRKKPVAPIPPSTLCEVDHQRDLMPSGLDKASLSVSYPSGSSTLNRPHKPKDGPKTKTSIGINTDAELLPSSQRRKSLTTPEDTHRHVVDVPKVPFLVNSDAKTATAFKEPIKAKPAVAQQSADNCDSEHFKTTVTHQVHQQSPEISRSSHKPVAAPRSLVSADDKSGVACVGRSSSMRSAGPRGDNTTSKSMSEVINEVQIRRPEALERLAKPEVPARPASLLQKRSSNDTNSIDSATLHKTQCSVYSVANKQQPNIVSVRNNSHEKFQPGHDNQIAEKERFLGHLAADNKSQKQHHHHQSGASSIENRFEGVNFNKPPAIGSPPKAALKPGSSSSEKPDPMHKLDERLTNATTKSTEKLNENHETNNGNKSRRPSHIRTRSEGNLVDMTGGVTAAGGGTAHTPSSPRSLNKPTEPPPPPPVGVSKANEPDNTAP